jgi:hypothetical protein
MISHVVLLKFVTPDSPDINKVCNKLSNLSGKIPQLKKLNVGVNLVKSSRAYDLALVAKFDSLSDLEEYEINPIHVEAAKYARSLASNIISVDFECVD